MTLKYINDLLFLNMIRVGGLSLMHTCVRMCVCIHTHTPNICIPIGIMTNSFLFITFTTANASREFKVNYSLLIFYAEIKMSGYFPQSEGKSKASLEPNVLGFVYFKARVLKLKCIRDSPKHYIKLYD